MPQRCGDNDETDMSNFATLKDIIAKCDAAQGLTATQMRNAMINMDRVAPSFGKSSHEFFTVDATAVTAGNVDYLPVTDEQFRAYVNHKREMLTKHSYL